MKLQALTCAICIGGAVTCAKAATPAPLEEVVVVAPYGTAIDPALVPANVQRALAEQLQRSQSFDLTDFLNRQFSSVMKAEIVQLSQRDMPGCRAAGRGWQTTTALTLASQGSSNRREAADATRNRSNYANETLLCK